MAECDRLVVHLELIVHLRAWGGVPRRARGDVSATCPAFIVSLLVAETTGALAASFMTILRLLAHQTRLPGATDNTRYGEGRASPRSFLTHHLANISTAIQAADAKTILNAASARMLRVSYGVVQGVCILSGQ